MFDPLTYEKGAGVLRMLERYIGAEQFREGIRLYLKRHSYGNTDAPDLWAALEESSGEPVSLIMDTWLHPVSYTHLDVYKRQVLAVCVKLEAEAAQLSDEERVEMSEGFGLGEGALARVARSAYHLLGLRTFLTTGDKESRAWSFRAGATAPECAGVIHSDLQRGFIRAEVIYWDQLIELGSWTAAKAAGRIRVEGSQYVVEDGDVLEIRFNV